MQSLDEVLEHSSIQKEWKQIITSDEKVELGPVEADALDPKQMSLLCAVLPTENVRNLQEPANAVKRELAEGAAETVRRQVSGQLKCVDGSQSLEKLALELRSIDLCSKLRGNHEASIMTVYSVESAGEHMHDARRSATPVRKDHMEKVMKAILSTRGELPDWEDSNIVFPALDPSDMHR